MGRDSQPYRPDVFRLHAEVNHPLPIGVHFQFIVKRRQGPVENGGFNLFHFHIGTFDDSNLNGAATVGHPFARPGSDLLQYLIGIRQVGLQRHAGVVMTELFLVQGTDECLGGDRQIAVRFHVEIDKLFYFAAVVSHKSVRSRRPVELGKTLFQNVDGMVERQGLNLGKYRRNFHRDVFDRRIFEGLEIQSEAGKRLLLADHLFPDVINVDPQALIFPLLQVCIQRFRFTRNNHMVAVAPHCINHRRHRQTG